MNAVCSLDTRFSTWKQQYNHYDNADLQQDQCHAAIVYKTCRRWHYKCYNMWPWNNYHNAAAVYDTGHDTIVLVCWYCNFFHHCYNAAAIV